MKFNSAEEMFQALQSDDLYNPILEKYIWIYNDDETSIVCANVSPKEAKEYTKMSAKYDGEYWGAFRRGGDPIYDNDEIYELLEEYYTSPYWEYTDSIYKKEPGIQYLLDYGSRPTPENEEFTPYKNYDPSYGYYDYKQILFDTLGDALTEIKTLQKEYNNAKNYYAIITLQTNLKTAEKNQKEDYINIIYYEGQIDGKPLIQLL